MVIFTQRLSRSTRTSILLIASAVFMLISVNPGHLMLSQMTRVAHINRLIQLRQLSGLKAGSKAIKA